MFRRRSQTAPEVPPTPAPLPDPGEGREATARADERLVRAAQAGDLDAFNLLVLRHERVVFNLCLRLLRDVPSAEDATQDTFVRAWTNIGGFRIADGGHVRAWLLRIATNRSYDLLRAGRRRPASPLEAEQVEIEPIWSTQGAGEEPPEVFALRAELGIHLERALAALPDDQRLAVLLADVQGCDYREVAAVTGAALGTVKSRLSRARARLRQELRDDPVGGELFERYGRSFGDPNEAESAGRPDRGAAKAVDGVGGINHAEPGDRVAAADTTDPTDTTADLTDTAAADPTDTTIDATASRRPDDGGR